MVRFGSEGGSRVEAGIENCGKVGEEGGRDGTELVGTIMREEKWGGGWWGFLVDGGEIERIPESRNVEEKLDDDTSWEDKDFVKNGNWVSSNITCREAYIREEAISKQRNPLCLAL